MSLVATPTIAAGGTGYLAGGSGTILLEVTQLTPTGGTGRPAVVQATVTSGVVTAISSVLDAGAYVAPSGGTWSAMPPVSAAPTTQVGAVGTATVSGGLITSIALSNVTAQTYSAAPSLLLDVAGAQPYATGILSGGATGTLTGVTINGGGGGINPNSQPVGVTVPAPPGGSGATLNPSFGVSALNVIDSGSAYPTSGTTVAFSGGSPTTAATAGTPTVTPNVVVLAGTITGYTDAQHVTISTASSQNLSGVSTLVFWGHDDLPTLQVAVNSGGKILVPAGSYWTSGPLVMPLNGSINGSSQNTTNISLMPGANSDIIQSANVYTYLGTSYSGATPDNFEVGRFHLMGNYLGQVRVNPEQQNGIALYAAGYNIHDLVMDGIVGNKIRSGYQQYGGGGGHLDNVITTVGVYGCGRNAWEDAGPHDQESTGFVPVDCGQEGDNIYYGLREIGYSSGGTHTALHPWHNGTAINRMAADLYSTTGSSTFTGGSEFEGGRANMIVTNGGDQFTSSSAYAHYGSAGSAFEVVNGYNTNHVGFSFSGTNAAPWYAIQIGGPSAPAAENNWSAISMNQFATLTPFNFANSTGTNIFQGVGQACCAASPAVGGTQLASDYFSYYQIGGTNLTLTPTVAFPTISADLAYNAHSLTGIGSGSAYIGTTISANYGFYMSSGAFSIILPGTSTPLSITSPGTSGNTTYDSFGGTLATINTPLKAPSLATTGGTVKGTLCVDTTGAVYVKTTTGACL